jgi:hypothetical protein
MQWLEEFIKKHPFIQKNYEQQVIEGIRDEKNELKRKVPAHQWWEIDDIDGMELDLPIKEKDRLRGSELHSGILEIMDSKGVNSSELKQIMDDLENVAQTLNDHDKKEMEIMLLEGLVNATLSSRNAYDQFYEILGPELRKMCDSNNAFWIELGEKNKREREERYAQLVERKKREDAAKKTGSR